MNSVSSHVPPSTEIDLTFGGKVQNIPMKKEAGMHMIQHWVDTMLSSFMAAFAERRIKNLPANIVDEFGECNKKATNIPRHARCVSKLLKNQFKGQKTNKNQTKTIIVPNQSKKAKATSALLEKYQKRAQRSKTKASGKMLPEMKRAKREDKIRDNGLAITNSNGYELKSTRGQMTPLGGVAQMLLKAVLAAKNKTHATPWKETIGKISQNAKERKEKRKWLEGESSIEDMDQLVFRGMRQKGIVNDDLPSVFNDPAKLKQWISKKKNSTKCKEPMEKLLALLRQGLKLGYTIAGKNTTDFDDKTLKIVSPRFLSVVPEEDQSKNETVDFLSPSLFALHNKGNDVEQAASLPNLMRNFSVGDQDKWMDLIMEAAGVVEQVEKLDTDYKKAEDMDEYRKRYEKEFRAKDGTPLYFTPENITKFGNFEQRKIDTHVNLSKSLSKEQIKEMNRTGYVLMTPAQMNVLYGAHSPYNNSDALRRFQHVNSSNLETLMERDVHRAAALKSFKIRQRDIVLSPISFTTISLTLTVSQGIILSPVIFSALILAPAVLGPVVLSPVIFTPVILSPRALSPVILSPFAFVPFVLSPLALYPIVLSPGIFIPIILSPMVLAPFILSPVAFTPIILSPLALSPFILNPAVGSPLVLSPFVLTPILFSPQALGALVLSPYALSPVIQSKLFAYSVILSPSWLS
ncbi:moulting cycle domain-containing protein [Ditylenchus destructor]|uniref:Moulting cycle domain-containing protein n=1 Tax=Ditylenchus destructor TaxID=166010 RepID=A0AAD4R0W0_9BILA|nr:moulting cycle domain-containing protein [Ditylenchus destructor]